MGRLSEKKKHCHHPVGQKLLDIMTKKSTCLALSADVTLASDLLSLAELLGPALCVLKTHVDILTDFSSGFVRALQGIARRHDFLLFEDRKFADIGHTVQLQYREGLYRIAEWADIVNAHPLPGPGVIQGLRVPNQASRGVLLLASMSSAGNLFTPEHAAAALGMAEDHADIIMGFVAQQRVSPDPRWLNFMPGVQFSAGSDTLGQGYVTPQQAISDCFADVIIVGRGILESPDPLAAAQAYREAAWTALNNC